MAWIRNSVLTGLLIVAVCASSYAKQCDLPTSRRFDCFLEQSSDQSKCESRGCCWAPALHRGGVALDTPYCFYPTDFGGYRLVNRTATKIGYNVELKLAGPGGAYGENIESLVAEFRFETKRRLRIKIRDKENARYKVPIPTAQVEEESPSQDYDVTLNTFPFGFKVTRKSTGNVIFDSTVGGFVFSDQFIQLSSLLPSHDIYGLGEHVLGLRLNTKWTELTLFSRDAATPEGGYNLYGVHPFYLNIEDNGNANGVFLLNSNAIDIVLQPTPAITYRTIGGILDFSIFLGPTPDDVIQQYTDVIGKPVLPPYWSLGFHLCRWGYNSVDGVKKVLDRMAEHGIPQDVQWNDIDYMHNKLDFTTDPKNYKDLGALVDTLHTKGMHYVPILDPAISNTQSSYDPYISGLEKNVFIRTQDGDILVGKVWPGSTVFPDFFHPNASVYWSEHLQKFYKAVNFDGLWIDMNEPSNFVQGSSKGCPKSKYESPPYKPHVIGGELRDKTLCMTAKQHLGIHYDLHNLYGFSEGFVTMNALRKLRSKRSLVIGRSSFSGSGAHQGHWLGDNHSNWNDLYLSIAGILNFNLFGVPLVGADICGFNGDTTEELCSRWMQLGAFYPFSRNHNTIGAKDQDPAAFGDQLIEASKSALMMRYKLLPYLNTLFYLAHSKGSAVARPLFYEFPKDKNTLGVDSQFLWGNALLITPVVTEGAKSVQGYFPKGTWYDIYEGARLDSTGMQVELQAGFDRVNLHVREGYIIPMQEPATTTTQSRRNPFALLVAPDSSGKANGLLYLDDGDVLDPLTTGKYSLIVLELNENTVTISPSMTHFTPAANLANLIIFGVQRKPTAVSVNGITWRNYTFNQQYERLEITSLEVQLLKNNAIAWK